MHPSKSELRALIEGNLGIAEQKEISKHVDICEFCQEFCNEYRLFLEADKSEDRIEIPNDIYSHIAKINKMANGRNRNLIDLKCLPEYNDNSYLLVADGKPESKPKIENITALYAEQPALVLNVMRDNSQNKHYLQLISKQQHMKSYVMIKIPGINKEYFTDKDGIVNLDEKIYDTKNLIWQIGLPDAIFSLYPFKYYGDKNEYSKELDFITEKNDKVKIRFDGKHKGKQISLSIIELEGQKDFGDVKILIVQKENMLSQIASPTKAVDFQLTEVNSEVNIRLFRL